MSTKVSNLGENVSSKPLKRKEVTRSSNPQPENDKGRAPKRTKIQDARTIVTQTSDAAFSNGQLNLQAFLKAREFEITALEDGLRRSKGALTTRAFQQVPRALRRRTSSHNVKRVPRRLQKRAAKEMKEDNTPTIKTNKRSPTSSRGRIRAETAKQLGLLSKRKAATLHAKKEEDGDHKTPTGGVIGRTPRPKLKKDVLNEPPNCPPKYRKRQRHKTWLPTHIYHAKRARMTEPTRPLWRFAIPLTPTEKSYRPTHRAAGASGALCWDMSYMSTIGLEGTEQGVEKVMRLLGVTSDDVWGKRGCAWREGRRCWNGWISRDDKSGRKLIGPATIFWCAQEPLSSQEAEPPQKNKKPLQRQVQIRVHPAAFLELWNEVLRISKMQRPVVRVEDLRFEIGSIELSGPGSTETLLGILHPYENPMNPRSQGHAQIFKSLGGLTNPASLPQNALLSFSIQDPRLHYPPRKVDLPRLDDEEASFSLLQTLSTWPADQFSPSGLLFSRDARLKATHLPSQKSLNRRKGHAPPGEYPVLLETDTQIPIILYTTSNLPLNSAQGTWTLLAPWKCILPIWYGLIHYPLSSGGNPRFSGLQELRQTHFEQGRPWFPADYPGTDAGWTWEMNERQQRKSEWDGRPKGKRTEFESLDLGGRRKGEVGLGWACDFDCLMQPSASKVLDDTNANESTADQKTRTVSNNFQHLGGVDFSLLSNPEVDLPPMSLMTVRITLFSRGVPRACARIYRLPPQSSLPERHSIISSCPTTQPPPKSGVSNYRVQCLRAKWTSLIPPAKPQATPLPKSINRRPPLSAIPASQRGRALAEMLLEPPPTYPASQQGPGDTHPPVPDEDQLIGFVTTGSFNLAVGRGTAIGSVWAARALERIRAGMERGRENRLCIVRNAGESVGRLGIWEVV